MAGKPPRANVDVRTGKICSCKPRWCGLCNKLVFIGVSAMFAQTLPEKFRSSLFKGSQGLGAAPRVATRKWRNSPCRSKRAGEVNWVAKATQEENPHVRRGSPLFVQRYFVQHKGRAPHPPRSSAPSPRGKAKSAPPFRLCNPTDKLKVEVQTAHLCGFFVHIYIKIKFFP